MVKIIGVKTITTENGKEFSMLVIQGEIEPLVSNKTGKIYLTMRTANLPTTFDVEASRTLIGRELPGRVAKVECEPYEYIVKETGEILILKHNWQYIDDDLIKTHEQVISQALVN